MHPPVERRHATLTIKTDTKRRIEAYANAGRWTQCALIDLLLDRYASELPEPIEDIRPVSTDISRQIQ
jgi:hypothetical protein